MGAPTLIIEAASEPFDFLAEPRGQMPPRKTRRNAAPFLSLTPQVSLRMSCEFDDADDAGRVENIDDLEEAINRMCPEPRGPVPSHHLLNGPRFAKKERRQEERRIGEKLLTRDQVARLCKVAPQTVFKWCVRGLRRGRLRSIRIHGLIFIPRSAITEFLESNERLEDR